MVSRLLPPSRSLLSKALLPGYDVSYQNILSGSPIYGEIAFLGIGPPPETNQIAWNSARVVDPDWEGVIKRNNGREVDFALIWAYSSDARFLYSLGPAIWLDITSFSLDSGWSSWGNHTECRDEASKYPLSVPGGAIAAVTWSGSDLRISLWKLTGLKKSLPR